MENLNTVIVNVAKDGYFKFRVYNNPEVRNETVRNIGLSSRAKNAFLRSGYRTVGDIIDHWKELDYIRGLGKKTVQEIRYAVCAHQYSVLNETKKKDYLMDIVRLNTVG